VLGALVGLLCGPIGAVAAGGLTLRMLLGMLVRHRIHDPPRLMLPAAALAVVNGTLLALHLY